MEDVVKAYVAGIIDGEGTVTLTKHHKNQTPSPEVSISNNNLLLLKWIRKKVGGVIVSKKKRKLHHSNSYTWRLRQNKAIDFLNEIKKHLLIKRRQADLITQEYKRVTHRAGKYTPQLLSQKNKLVNKIRALNQR